MSETNPPPSQGGIDIDRQEQFPEIDTKPASFWTLATQFFIAPMAIAIAAVGVFVLASVLTSSERGLKELIHKIEIGGRNERKQAAFDLAQYLQQHKDELDEQQRGAVISLFEVKLNQQTAEANEEEKIALQFLALCMAHLGDDRAGNPLRKGLASQDEQLRFNCLIALGHIGDVRNVPHIAQVLIAPDKEPTVRSTAAWVLGSLLRTDAPDEEMGRPGWDDHLKKGRHALYYGMTRDSDTLVRFNASVALGQTGDTRAVEGLGKLLNLETLKQLPFGQTPAAEADKGKLTRDREDAILQAIKVAGKLGDPRLRDALEKLTECESEPLRIAAKSALAALEKK